MNPRILGRTLAVTTVIVTLVIAVPGDPPPAKVKPRRFPSRLEPERPLRDAPRTSAIADRERPVLNASVVEAARSTAALREILRCDPERFLDLLETDRASRELATERLFPRRGEIPAEERSVLLESLWEMTLGGRRAAALLIGRFEQEETLLNRMVGFLRSTADGEVASWLVQGLRESRSNLGRGGPELAEAIVSQLRLRDDPQLLGGLADLSRLAPDKLQARDWIGVFAAYLVPGVTEEIRIHAVCGAGAWPEAGTPLLLDHFAVEPSPGVRLAILRFTARRSEGRESLLRAIQSDPDPDVRRFAAESARMACDASSVARLEQMAACEADDRVVRALKDSIAVLSQKGIR